jgi:hypothetical protein
MNDLQRVVASLQSKIEKLIHLHKKYEEENTQLLFEKGQLLSGIELKNKHIKELEEQIKIVQSSARLSVEQSSGQEENKLKINELVKEIEECIAMLNK